MTWLNALIFSLAVVESCGDASAVGDDGAALGLLQIHPGVIDDVNRLYATSYTHRDALSPNKAILICRLYLQYWARRDGPASPEKCARIWNGGPRGHLTEATLAYWERVRESFGRVTETQEAAIAALGGMPCL